MPSRDLEAGQASADSPESWVSCETNVGAHAAYLLHTGSPRVAEAPMLATTWNKRPGMTDAKGES